ncbi:putative tRNA (guanine(26)-N(2))-dimethyltransferase [Arabidopsis thaliana]|jgi:tRNA (guanine26-N2/guanine27-N2)-dimethyltransferase|uniref:tRNA (guanine(26)-N(2))-dimethyltransferase 2 n=3 Tax=Arabidopsis TaxID=3701 RepID=TRM2_ARATH|nr:N2,N2-dimethylguanosine tRNA methyltransferase [Arabidopsis thaliana]Q9SRU7.3 RecName: Full=tRNA (guanine(26)-N(2))-dimethyltransferase 2; AltName: Full=tRNA 2,2-dimethylguanosine-26 methyltransferase 2; AltName: Full=tRNA(guanine-26,N(2)-N(2)) methyltransferase 2; AltName: Full=tRNA(m(2,2)G26)dimethyltransferase 2 [Arabidopsis thaliana]KAG7623728.1 tRNA methyltransferase Trm1 [Arabidopsis thaliana x Arabidopsis arenosa]AEE73792.1 N2,N2-dimethylguanosine tRNA methyltransferase [Arabidopsis th|eukprot:NP_186881.2 N2,N2-dimethylguanosine tRNA methyltransferase [Arabidopsis thaliana]
METDLNDYTVIKEGEAEILMHKKNQVFFNKAQVNNRDMSIAVLREFLSKRKQEHEAKSSKRTRPASKVIEKDASEASKEETPSENGMNNGDHEVASEDGPSSVSKDPAKTTERFAPREPKPPKVLEALSASGLRALRYAREIEGIGQVVALDNDLASVEACQRNIKFNGSVAISKVESHHTDARVHMLTHPKEFDVVDLDPYGSPSIFLDSAIQSVTDGGLLMCTATDMAVLCGGNGEVCYSKYGSYPLRAKYCHEMALRILLASIESHANRYKRYIVPVLSVQMDFYVRVFVRVYTSASAMKNTPLKLSYVYQCIGCDSFHLQPVGRSLPKNNSVRYLPAIGPVVKQDCNHCGKKYNMGGPIWSAPMHDPEWVTSILNSVKSMKDRYPAYDRISAVLTTVSEELLDVPLFLSLHNLCATLKCISPSAAMFRSAVINANYRISGTHVNPLGMKTDAPMEVIWDIMRCWVKNHPIKAQSPEQPGSVILSKEPSHEVDFSRHIGSLSKAQAKKVARFLPNPEKHWGPKLRAGRQITSKHVSLIGHEAVNGHLSQHHEELKEEDEEAEPEDNVQDKVDPKRQKTATDNITST